MKVIVGLGNPGKKYENTRHNIGFMAIDKLKEKLNLGEEKSKFQALIMEKNINGEKYLFVKPQTFVNLSGNSIIEIVNFYKIDSQKDLIIIYDDMDLPLGQLRIKNKGSSGGHNGMKSIISHIGENFIRIRGGIDKAKGDVIDYVIGKFNQSEQKILEEMIEKIVDCIEDVIKGADLDQLMQNYNRKK